MDHGCLMGHHGNYKLNNTQEICNSLSKFRLIPLMNLFDKLEYLQ